jgi:hypothetical protein
LCRSWDCNISCPFKKNENENKLIERLEEKRGHWLIYKKNEKKLVLL